MQFTLRPFEEGDAFSLAKAANNEKIALNMREGFPHPYRPSDAKAFIAGCRKHGDFNRLIRAIVVGGNAVGSIGVTRSDPVFRRAAEIGYYLAEDYWGQGIMAEAVSRMVRLAFERFDIARISAEVYGENKASMRVLEKAGFTFEGILRQSYYRDGKILDGHVWAILRGEAAAR
jgi:ribosomal-protein-alanine N-acetyltransferase